MRMSSCGSSSLAGVHLDVCWLMLIYRPPQNPHPENKPAYCTSSIKSGNYWTPWVCSSACEHDPVRHRIACQWQSKVWSRMDMRTLQVVGSAYLQLTSVFVRLQNCDDFRCADNNICMCNTGDW
jgi:hypothetical protein